MTKTIEWADVGPVKNISIDVPEGGGLVVFEGPNGQGKTHLLDALDDALMAERKGGMPVRDGAPRAEVDVFGQSTLRRSRKLSRSGKLEVETLSGKFSVADLVDPKLLDPFAADAKRIKALIQLTSNSKADPALFYSLVGGQEAFDEHVASGDLKTEDLVTMAAKVKAAFEKAARKLEDESKTKYAQAEAARLSAADVDTNLPCDSKVLSDEYERATREESRLQEAAKAYSSEEKRHKDAAGTIQIFTADYKGLSVDAANELKQSVVQNCIKFQAVVDRLKKELAEAENSLVAAEHANEIAAAKLDEAMAHEDSLDKLNEIVGAALPEPVLPIDIETAASSVVAARLALETGVTVRKAKADLENAVRTKSEARTIEAKAVKFRDAAQSTDNVLADAVKSLGVPLSVSNSRLIITNSDRNETHEELFEDLSKGEKCSVVIGIAIEAVGQGGLFTIPQEFWEGLNPENQTLIAQKLENSGVVAITAKAVDGDGITSRVVEAFPLGG